MVKELPLLHMEAHVQAICDLQSVLIKHVGLQDGEQFQLMHH